MKYRIKIREQEGKVEYIPQICYYNDCYISEETKLLLSNLYQLPELPKTVFESRWINLFSADGNIHCGAYITIREQRFDKESEALTVIEQHKKQEARPAPKYIYKEV